MALLLSLLCWNEAYLSKGMGKEEEGEEEGEKTLLGCSVSQLMRCYMTSTLDEILVNVSHVFLGEMRALLKYLV